MTEIQLTRKEKKLISQEVDLINKLYGVYDVDELIIESLNRIEIIVNKKKENA